MKKVDIITKHLVSRGEVFARIHCDCGDTKTQVGARITDFAIPQTAICECGRYYVGMMGPNGLSVYEDLSRSLVQK